MRRGVKPITLAIPPKLLNRGWDHIHIHTNNTLTILYSIVSRYATILPILEGRVEPSIRPKLSIAYILFYSMPYLKAIKLRGYN